MYFIKHNNTSPNLLELQANLEKNLFQIYPIVIPVINVHFWQRAHIKIGAISDDARCL